MESKDYMLISLVILGIAGFILYKALVKNPTSTNTTQDSLQSALPPTAQTTDSYKNSTAATPVPTQAQVQTAAKQWSKAPDMTLDPTKDYHAIIHTTDGNINIDLYEKEDPITVNNFVFLAQQKFYDNTKFHRIIKDFMIQGGDPLGTGAGGPGYQFADEPITRSYTAGTLAMANSGPNTNGSQFFIMHKDYELPKNYVIFGKAEDADSLAIVDKIANTPVGANTNIQGENSVPLQDVLITSVDIVTK